MHKAAPFADLGVRASAQPSARLGLLLLLRLSRPWAWRRTVAASLRGSP